MNIKKLNNNKLIYACIMHSIDKSFPAFGTPLDSCVLKNLAEFDNIEPKEELQKLYITKKEKLLQQHKAPISFNEKQQRWFTRLPNKSAPIFRKNKADLEDVVIEYYSKLELDTQKCTLTSIYDEYLKYRKMKVKTDTYNKTIDYYKRYIEPYKISKIDISSITRLTYISWCSDIITTFHMKKQYFKNVTAVFNTMIQFALMADLIPYNPIRDVKILDECKTLFTPTTQHDIYEEALNLQEITELMQEAEKDFETHSFSLSVIILLKTGLRIGELLGLRYSDFNFEKRSLRVCRMKSKTEAPDQDIHGVVPRLKKDTPPRTIPVDNETLDLVKRLRRRNKELDFPVGDNDYIFWANNRYTNFDTVLCTDWMIRNRIYTYSRRCGFSYTYSPHDLRRTYASILFQRNVSINRIQLLLGHRSPEMTNKYLRDILPAQQEDDNFHLAMNDLSIFHKNAVS